MALLADYSSQPVSAAALKQAGYQGAVRYISPGREAWMKAKPLSKNEVEDFKKHGLELVSVWQYLKEDWRGGFNSGAENARKALQKHKELGAPSKAPVFFAIDSDPTLFEYNNIVAHYIKGILSVIPKDQFGLYCNSKVHAWAEEDGFKHMWWKHNWGSDGELNGCHIHQFEIDRAEVAGVKIDRNRTYQNVYGQWSAYQNVATKPVVKPAQGINSLGDLLKLFTDKFKSLVGQSTFATTLPHYIQLIDASHYRIEKKTKAAEEKLAQVELLLKQQKDSQSESK